MSDPFPIALRAGEILDEMASGRSVDDLVLFVGDIGVTSAATQAGRLLACAGPARRALRINPTDVLRHV